jgi:DNA-directed RNA polymerase subunit F
MNKKSLSIPEAKEILEKIDLEKADQIQKRTLDYLIKFSKIETKQVLKKKEILIKECNLSNEEAIELINIMPKTFEEIRTFTAGWKKLIPTEVLQKIIKALSS